MSTRSTPYYKRRKGVTNAHPWRDGCSSHKFRFTSQEQALLYALFQPDEMNAYHHAPCGGWHLTTIKDEMNH